MRALTEWRMLSFFAADAGDIASVTDKDFDAIIVDPPRKGCDKRTLDFIIEKNPQRLVYISCDSATLARDLAILKDNFEILTVTPVDMFPRTHHVETVALLSQMKPDDYVTIELNEEDLQEVKSK